MTGEPKTFASGDPVMIWVITIEQDNGESIALWARGGKFTPAQGSGASMLSAIGEAVQKAGASSVDVGASRRAPHGADPAEAGAEPGEALRRPVRGTDAERVRHRRCSAAVTANPSSGSIPWHELTPDLQRAYAKAVADKTEGKADPIEWWNQADQRHWLWQHEHPDAARGEYAAYVAAVEAGVDPATTAAFQGLVELRSPVLGGRDFIFGQPADLTPRWGRGHEVLWERGESLFLVGPTGVGKTTLGGQLVQGLVGVADDVLGFPIEPAKRVLYLAMDRPRQVARAWARLFKDDPMLNDRLSVWQGPLPIRLESEPSYLATIAVEHEADVLVIDSLKDLVTQMSEDGPAGAFNMAMRSALPRGHRRACAAPSAQGRRRPQANHARRCLRQHLAHGRRGIGGPLVGRSWGRGDRTDPPQAARRPDRTADRRARPPARHVSVSSGWDALQYLNMRGFNGGHAGRGRPRPPRVVTRSLAARSGSRPNAACAAWSMTDSPRTRPSAAWGTPPATSPCCRACPRTVHGHDQDIR